MHRLTRRQVREVDRIAIEEYGLPGVVLMENAARGAVDVLLSLERGAVVAPRAWIFCGGGNNGGDGFAMARHLHNRSWDVRLVLATPPHALRGDALVNWRVAQRMQIPWEAWETFDLSGSGGSGGVVIDAIFGTGFRPDRLPPMDLAKLSAWASAPGRLTLAVDIPSGMDADTGASAGGNVFRADHTVTFVAEKAGFANPEAAAVLGRVHVVDIGAPVEILDRVRQIA